MMKLNPKVSIIIPVYNGEKYINKCLKSLIGQTLKDIEIICIDDGSTDNSLEVLNSFAKKDNRIKVLTQNNSSGGVSAARNMGIKAASGEYLGFVDIDDWVDRDFFEKLYNAAIQNNCNMAAAGYKRCKRFKTTIKQRFKNIDIFDDMNAIVKVLDVPGHCYIWNKIYKRENWLKAGISFPLGRYYEDIAIILKMFYAMGNLVVVPKVYYHYKQTPNSIITKRKHKKDVDWAMEEFYNFAKEHNIALSPEEDRKIEYIKFFNITILKICYSKNLIKYKLFGFITFLTKITI